jgi:hypothetical protein
MGIVVFSERKL